LCSSFTQDINYLENPFYSQEIPEATVETIQQASDSDSDEVDVECSSSEDEDMLSDRMDHQTVIVVKKNNSAITQVVVEEHSDHCYTSPVNMPYLTPPQSSSSSGSSSEEEDEAVYLGQPPKHKYQYVISRDTSKRKKVKEEMSLIKKNSDKTVQLRIRETVGGRKTASKQKMDAAQSERQRRVEIANSFDLVRNSVPNIAGNEKVSKLVILNAARDHIHKQNTQHVELKKQKSKMTAKNAELKKQLLKLQLQIAKTVRI